MKMKKNQAMPKQPEACDAKLSLLMLLREAHEMLDLIGCSPEGIEKTKAAAASLQGRIDAAIESAGKPTWWPAHGKDASDNVQICMARKIDVADLVAAALCSSNQDNFDANMTALMEDIASSCGDFIGMASKDPQATIGQFVKDLLNAARDAVARSNAKNDAEASVEEATSLPDGAHPGSGPRDGEGSGSASWVAQWWSASGLTGSRPATEKEHGVQVR